MIVTGFTKVIIMLMLYHIIKKNNFLFSCGCYLKFSCCSTAPKTSSPKLSFARVYTMLRKGFSEY